MADATHVFVDVALRYGEGTYVSARVVFEVDDVAGMQSMIVRAWSLASSGRSWHVGLLVSLVLLLMTTVAQVFYEVDEMRAVGRGAYLRDFWNYIECLIIIMNSLLVVVGSLTIGHLFELAPFEDLATSCLAQAAAATDACPTLPTSSAISLCRTQALWVARGDRTRPSAFVPPLSQRNLRGRAHLYVSQGLGEIVHDCSVLAATIFVLAAVHWIKYMELVPRLALPIYTLTATALDLLALFVVVTLCAPHPRIACLACLAYLACCACCAREIGSGDHPAFCHARTSERMSHAGAHYARMCCTPTCHCRRPLPPARHLNARRRTARRLLLCFAVIMMMVLGPSSANFATFNDAVLSAFLLTVGNIECVRLACRQACPPPHLRTTHLRTTHLRTTHLRTRHTRRSPGFHPPCC